MATDDKEEGPITKKVKDRWDEILGYVEDGLEYQYHIKQLEDYLDAISKKILVEGHQPNSPEVEDLSEAQFWFDYRKTTDLPYSKSHRMRITEFSGRASHRIANIADDLLKFGVKTVLISHGAVLLASLGALAQSLSDELNSLIVKVVALSVFGLFISGLALIGLIFRYNYVSGKLSEASLGHLSNDTISKIYSEMNNKKWPLIFDGLLYFSFFILFVEGVMAFYYLNK